MCTPKMEISRTTSCGDYKDDLVRLIKCTSDKMTRAVESFNSPIATRPINIKDLETFPLHKWIPLNDKVDIRKRKKRFGNYLCFDTRMKENGRFGQHFHNDIIESTEVIYGEMLDTTNNEIYKAGDIAHYEKGEIHTPIATKDTLLHVLFKP